MKCLVCSSELPKEPVAEHASGMIIRVCTASGCGHVFAEAPSIRLAPLTQAMFDKLNRDVQKEIALVSNAAIDGRAKKSNVHPRLSFPPED